MTGGADVEANTGSSPNSLQLLSRILIRGALLCLMLGWTLGAIGLGLKATPFGSWVGVIVPIHRVLLVQGWTLGLVLGVAYWIFPRFAGGRRGRETPVRFAVGAWAVGTLMSVVGASGALLERIHVGCATNSQLATLFSAGQFAVFSAAVAFAIHAIPRIKPFGRSAEL